MSTSPTGIAVTAKFSIIFFTLYLFKPTVEIDGVAQDGKWGTTHYPTAAGQHSVTVYWKYLWFLPVNKATINVTVPDGGTVDVTYKPRWLIFMPGKIELGAPAAA